MRKRIIGKSKMALDAIFIVQLPFSEMHPGGTLPSPRLLCGMFQQHANLCLRLGLTQNYTNLTAGAISRRRILGGGLN
ncbi:MAG: hypothetical protein ACOYN5_15300 [Bacteroidales bacterium]